MSELGTVIARRPVQTPNQILPLKMGNQLDPPFNDGAAVNASTNELTYTCSVLMPVEITNFMQQVAVQQYYAGSGTTLEFYFVYDIPGPLSGNFTQYDVSIGALPATPNGTPLTLSTITTINSLIKNTDPKTSRGTHTSVVSTSNP